VSNKLRDVPRFLNGGAVGELAVWQGLAKRRVPAFFEEEFRDRLENATNKKQIIPSREQVAEKFKELDQLLLESACSNNAEEQLKVRQLFLALIGGKISLYQMGERKSKKGYL